MPTIEEVRTEWKTIRSALGNLICYIEGKTAQLQDMSEAYRKGYNDGIEKGSLDVKDRISCACQGGYKDGLNLGWNKAWAIRNEYTVSEMEDLFGLEYAAIADLDPEYAIQKLKEHDAIIYQVTHSNAQKFVEVFGFAPGYEILDDGREVYPSLNDEFWNAEYKEPQAGEGER